MPKIFSISEAVKARIVCVRMCRACRCQQRTGGRLFVRGLEDAHLVIPTESPIHLLNSDSHRLHLGGPGGHPLGGLLGGLDALVGELHQTSVDWPNLRRFRGKL